MSDISELEARLTHALERIRQGVAQMSATPAPAEAAVSDGEDVAALRAQLEDEQTANAQLEERVKTIRKRQEQRVKRLEVELSEATEAVARLEQSLADIKSKAEALRQSNSALRAANEENVGEPRLINKAMMAELEALRAVRRAEAEEAGAILDALKPIVEGADRA
ncbi:MAG: hypothetical protein AAGH17_02730 [Pseudomonadota bacterium]